MYYLGSMKIIFYKKFSRNPIFLFGAMMLFLVSCNTGNKVVSTFGKRKYTSGYYSFLPAKHKEYKIQKTNLIAISSIKSNSDLQKKPEGIKRETVVSVDYVIMSKLIKSTKNLVSKISTLKPYSETTVWLCNSNKLLLGNIPGDGRHEQSKPDNSGKIVGGIILILLGIIGLLVLGFFVIWGSMSGGSLLLGHVILVLLLSLGLLIGGIIMVANS